MELSLLSEFLPLFIEPHWKVMLRTKVLLKAAHTLRLGRAGVLSWVSQHSCLGHRAAAVPRASMQGVFCLLPHVTHVDSPHHAGGHLLLATLGICPPQQVHVTLSIVSTSRWTWLSRSISGSLISPPEAHG